MLEKLFASFFKIQDSIFKRNTERKLKRYNKTRKHHLEGGCYVTLDSLAEEERIAMESEIITVLKSTEFDTEKILNYIRSQNIPIYYINEYLADFLRLSEGFIYPQKALRAILWNCLTVKKISFTTEPMFVFNKKNVDKYYLIYYLYNWFAYKRGVYGIDSESMALLEKYLYHAPSSTIKNLTLNEIYELKDAIKQDKAAIDFLIKLCKENEGVRNAFSMIKDKGASV